MASDPLVIRFDIYFRTLVDQSHEVTMFCGCGGGGECGGGSGKQGKGRSRKKEPLSMELYLVNLLAF